MYIISGCLLGHDCKYNGGNNRNEDVIKFCEDHRHVVVCPESAGKLPTPRPPAEIRGNRVIDKNGTDVTEAFIKGAQVSLKTCMQLANFAGEELEGAILKANSPSCGCGQVYDGTFSGTLVEGDGVFAAMLKKHGIDIITEKETIKW
ncbi:MAG: DUF523 domain-containing protein [Firmicutes bacterium]|nr:DUF523 domain-containing protein [Bacillota bacterium]